MGLYNRDAIVHEVANQLAGEYDADDYSVDEGLQSFVGAVSRETLRRALPTEEQLIDCSKEIIAMIQLSGSKADPDNEEYVRSIADTLTGSLFPYFKPTAVQDLECWFELPDV